MSGLTTCITSLGIGRACPFSFGFAGAMGLSATMGAWPGVTSTILICIYMSIVSRGSTDLLLSQFSTFFVTDDSHRFLQGHIICAENVFLDITAAISLNLMTASQ